MKWDDYVWRCDPELPQSAENCGDGYWGDSRVQAQPEILTRFQNALLEDYFIATPSRQWVR